MNRDSMTLRRTTLPLLRSALVFLVGIAICTPMAATEPTGHLTYTLSTENSTTSDGQQAYARIKIAMDSAMYYYNTYTHLTKAVRASYVPSVQTADGNSNGSIRFGSNKSYQVTLTAMHEIAHTLGIGTSTKWSNLTDNNKVYTGKNGTARLKEIDGPTAVLKGDDMHFWPYGLNYASEVKSNQDLINHCLVVDAIYTDLYPTAMVASDQTPAMPRFSVIVSRDKNLIVFSPSACCIEATVFSLAGRKVAGYSGVIERPGEFTVPLDCSAMSRGRYVYRIEGGSTRAGGTFHYSGER